MWLCACDIRSIPAIFPCDDETGNQVWIMTLIEQDIPEQCARLVTSLEASLFSIHVLDSVKRLTEHILWRWHQLIPSLNPLNDIIIIFLIPSPYVIIHLWKFNVAINSWAGSLSYWNWCFPPPSPPRVNTLGTIIWIIAQVMWASFLQTLCGSWAQPSLLVKSLHNP